ncbi:MAG: chemotaxis response regulator protein-glutamate methylesterase [Myxococcota bacterium]
MKRVLIVDDSALVRKLLSDIIESSPDFTVVGSARDPYEARELIKRCNPDVLTLDVEMPRMDGVTFLSNLMRLRPMPVLMVSSLTDKSADVTLKAMELGAVDYVSKPKEDLARSLPLYKEEVLEKLRTAARAQVRRIERKVGKPVLTSIKTTHGVIGIGASTGGTEAIRSVLERLPADAPGVVITQHIPETFSRAFARTLNAASAMRVLQAEGGEEIKPGFAFVAPGNRHLRVVRSGARYHVRLDDGPPVNLHKPAVDVMFQSIAQQVGRNAVCAILTGMGADGAAGLLQVRKAGGKTIAQDEASSVVYGMPREAATMGAADRILSLDQVPTALLAAFKERTSSQIG